MMVLLPNEPGYKHRQFSVKIAELILFIDNLGYGTILSNVKDLAIELNLFEKGEYLTGMEMVKAHEDIQEVWESMGGGHKTHLINVYRFKE